MQGFYIKPGPISTEIFLGRDAGGKGIVEGNELAPFQLVSPMYWAAGCT